MYRCVYRVIKYNLMEVCQGMTLICAFPHLGAVIGPLAYLMSQ